MTSNAFDIQWPLMAGDNSDRACFGRYEIGGITMLKPQPGKQVFAITEDRLVPGSPKPTAFKVMALNLPMGFCTPFHLRRETEKEFLWGNYGIVVIVQFVQGRLVRLPLMDEGSRVIVHAGVPHAVYCSRVVAPATEGRVIVRSFCPKDDLVWAPDADRLITNEHLLLREPATA